MKIRVDFSIFKGVRNVRKAKYRGSIPYLAGLITLWEC
jgi:hypothetical protein